MPSSGRPKTPPGLVQSEEANPIWVARSCSNLRNRTYLSECVEVDFSEDEMRKPTPQIRRTL